MSPSGDQRNRRSAPLQGGSGSPPGQMQASGGRYKGSGNGMSQNMPQSGRMGFSGGPPMGLPGPQAQQGLPTPQPGMAQNMAGTLSGPGPRPAPPMPPPWAQQSPVPTPSPASYGVPGGTVIPRGFMGAGMPQAGGPSPSPTPGPSPSPVASPAPVPGPSPVESGGPSLSPVSDLQSSPESPSPGGRMSAPWLNQGSQPPGGSDPQTLRQGAQQGMNRRNNTF